MNTNEKLAFRELESVADSFAFARAPKKKKTEV